MAALYPSTPVTGYNASPPPDDGTTVATNLVTWAGVKTKIGDPLNVYAAAADSNVSAAFGKTLDGAAVVRTATNYNMTAADQGRLIVATAAGITITTPDATVVTAPFTFSVNNQAGGTITVDGLGSQTVDGQLVQTLKAGAGCVVKTDGTNWVTFGLKPAQLVSVNPPYGFDAPINLGLVASVGSGILTIAVKTNSGNDPTPGDPVLIPFRDATIANGDPVWIAITAALSITTNAIGANLGVPNGTPGPPFRYWICVFNNAGTPVLALWHSGAASATTVIKPLDESSLQSATGISAAATANGTFYCPNGTTLTNFAVRKLGYLEYSAGLTNLNSTGFTSVPTKLQLFGPGVSSPGSVVQISAAASANSITPTSACNLVFAQASGSSLAGANASANLQTMQALYKRAAVTIAAQSIFEAPIVSGQNYIAPFSTASLDSPSSTSSLNYTISITVSGSFNAAGVTYASNTLQEIMG